MFFREYLFVFRNRNVIIIVKTGEKKWLMGAEKKFRQFLNKKTLSLPIEWRIV